jgi:hypothetical protein
MAITPEASTLPSQVSDCNIKTIVISKPNNRFILHRLETPLNKNIVTAATPESLELSGIFSRDVHNSIKGMGGLGK